MRKIFSILALSLAVGICAASYIAMAQAPAPASATSATPAVPAVPVAPVTTEEEPERIGPSVISPPAPVGTNSPAEELPSAKKLIGYRYSWADCEYNVELPEAPQVKSIWGEDKLPDFEKISTMGVIGERARYHRIDWQTEDFLKIDILCLQVPQPFLKSLLPGKIFQYLDREIDAPNLSNAKRDTTHGAETLSWSSIAGYHFDSKNRAIYNIAHYLTGLKTVFIINISYIADNPIFTAQFNMVNDSISLNKD